MTDSIVSTKEVVIETPAKRVVAPQMNYRSVEDLNQIILRNLHRIPSDIKLVAGIPRSGLLAANLIALYMNLPLTDLNGLREHRVLSNGKRPKRFTAEPFDFRDGRVLVVDDCVSQGTELRRAQSFVSQLGLSTDSVFLTVFSFPENPRLADITMQVVPRPMCFQWSVMHTPELDNYCLDIDGVLCEECPKIDDDDGPRYEAFLRNAKPLFLPTVKVGWLVTSRLEKYRDLTERWLSDHGIRYGSLIMLDLPTRQAREKAGVHASFKAEVYKRTGASLFIESDPNIASEIARRSGKRVLSMVTNSIIGDPQHDSVVVALARLRRVFHRLRRAPRKLLYYVSRPFGVSPSRMQS